MAVEQTVQDPRPGDRPGDRPGMGRPDHRIGERIGSATRDEIRETEQHLVNVFAMAGQNLEQATVVWLKVIGACNQYNMTMFNAAMRAACMPLAVKLEPAQH